MKVEIRSNGTMHVSGYVNAVERESRILPQRMATDAPGDFVEKVSAGAFKRAISHNDNVRMLFNHGRDIGGTGTGELTLTEDAIGLKAEADISDAEVRQAAEQGKLRGWSFGFLHPKSEYSPADNGRYRRTLTDFDLREVSILTNTPAYYGTSVEIREADAEEIEFRAVDDAAEVTSQHADFSAEINKYKKTIAELSC